MSNLFHNNNSENPEPSNSGPGSERRRGESEEPALISEDMLAPEDEKESRIDFERGMSYFPRLTIFLIIANIIVFMWEMSSGALQSQAAIIEAGALYRPSVLNGEFWRLGTAIFLHGGPDHLIGNCIILYILGMACEHAFHLKRPLSFILWRACSDR